MAVNAKLAMLVISPPMMFKAIEPPNVTASLNRLNESLEVIAVALTSLVAFINTLLVAETSRSLTVITLSVIKALTLPRKAFTERVRAMALSAPTITKSVLFMEAVSTLALI